MQFFVHFGRVYEWVLSMACISCVPVGGLMCNHRFGIVKWFARFFARGKSKDNVVLS